MNSAFSFLEKSVLQTILDAVPQYVGLRTQLESAHVASRDNNGYGFYTSFVIQPNLSPIDFSGRLHASAYLNGQHCGFMLWVKNGKADCLEGYPLGADEWPGEDKLEKVNFGVIDANPIH